MYPRAIVVDKVCHCCHRVMSGQHCNVPQFLDLFLHVLGQSIALSVVCRVGGPSHVSLEQMLSLALNGCSLLLIMDLRYLCPQLRWIWWIPPPNTLSVGQSLLVGVVFFLSDLELDPSDPR